MKPIRGKSELEKKLKKNTLLFDGHKYYLSDFHHTTVSRALAVWFIETRRVEVWSAWKKWFEQEWRWRKPVGNYLGVDIFRDDVGGRFFFRVKKGTYDMDTYDQCRHKIDYLYKLSEPLFEQ